LTVSSVAPPVDDPSRDILGAAEAVRQYWMPTRFKLKA
jgi:hypothetical protein